MKTQRSFLLKPFLINGSFSYPSHLKKSFIFLISFLTLSAALNAQKTEYKIIFRGDSIGNMMLYKNQAGSNVSFKTVSNVQVRFFIKVKVQSEEVSNFQNGRLMYSSVSRFVNGKEKTNRQTKITGNIYQATSFGKPVPITDELIDYNFSMMFCQEPLNKRTVYSDSFQQLLNIEEVALHRYKVVLPDGNYNYYTFKDGICNMAELHHSFYTIYLQLEV